MRNTCVLLSLASPFTAQAASLTVTSSQAEIYEPSSETEVGPTSTTIGVTFDYDAEMDNWQASECTITGTIVLGERTDLVPVLEKTNSSRLSSQAQKNNKAIISAAGDPIVDNDDYIVTGSTSFSFTITNIFQRGSVSETHEFDVVAQADTQEETDEQFYTNITYQASCNTEGQVDFSSRIDVRNLDDYILLKNTTVSEPPPTEPTEFTTLPEAQLTLQTQINDIAALTLHSSLARTKNLAKEIRGQRGNNKAFTADNLQIKLQGEAIPQGLWSNALNGDETSLNGMGAGDPLTDFGRWGFFANGTIEIGERSQSQAKDSEFDSTLITLGMDYQLKENFLMGAAYTYVDTKTDINVNQAETKYTMNSLSLFSSFYGKENYYLDLILSYGNTDYDLKREIATDLAQADTQGNEWNIATGAGYKFFFTKGTLNVFTLASYTSATVDGYTESTTGNASAAQINTFDLESFITNIGAEYSWNINTNYAVFVPQVSLDWEHQFNQDPVFVEGALIDGNTPGTFTLKTGLTDNNYFNANLGVSALFTNGISLFFTYETALERDDISADFYTLGGRWQF